MDRRAEVWRLLILGSLGLCIALAVGAVIFFLLGASEAQSAFRRYASMLGAGYRYQDDPRGFQPYIVLALLIASVSVAVLGAWRIGQRRIAGAVRLLSWAALGFVLCTLGAMWSSSILHPRVDDGAFYNCEAWVAGDRVALATLLLAANAVLCMLVAVWADRLAVWMPTASSHG